MTRRLLVGAVTFAILLFVLPQQAQAHVLIRDDSRAIGAVLHVVPDDDPVAGESADLYFDIQTGAINKDSAQLTITSDDGTTSNVPVEVDGNGVGAAYIFPAQGSYQLRLTVTSDKTYVFSYAQRVSRGVTGSALDRPRHPLASAALVFGLVALLLLAVVAINNRKGISRQSHF